MPSVAVSVGGGALTVHLPLHLDALSSAAFARAKAQAETAFTRVAAVEQELGSELAVEASLRAHLNELRSEGDIASARVRAAEAAMSGKRAALADMRAQLHGLQQALVAEEEAQVALRHRIAAINAVSCQGGWWCWLLSQVLAAFNCLPSLQALFMLLRQFRPAHAFFFLRSPLQDKSKHEAAVVKQLSSARAVAGGLKQKEAAAARAAAQLAAASDARVRASGRDAAELDEHIAAVTEEVSHVGGRGGSGGTGFRCRFLFRLCFSLAGCFVRRLRNVDCFD